MLSIRSFTKRFGAETVLQIDKLDLRVGVYLITGHNGSGKTTFFRCLAGISPCEGDISIDGSHLKRDAIAYRSVVNIAEAEPQYPAFLTARDLLTFVGRIKRSPAHQFAERLGINSFYNKPCGSYSSGMLKKLSLALAFSGNPRMIILDEPLTTLDASTRRTLLEMIAEKQETIFLLSSHHELDPQALTLTDTFNIKNKQLTCE